MAKKRRSVIKEQVEFLENVIALNGRAMEEGPKKKSWTLHNLKTIRPKTNAQEEMFHVWFEGKHVCAHGSAGTGKTFLALYLALNEVLSKRQQKIIIIRSAVPTREIGYLPGTLEEKTAAYEHPYHSILWELLGRQSAYQDMKDIGMIEFMTTSFVRGLTWDNSIIIVDEGQNLTFHEINSIMTRIGESSRIIFTGDTKQTDLDGKKLGIEGMSQALRVFNSMSVFGTIQFKSYDIVRSEFVKSWIVACEETIA